MCRVPSEIGDCTGLRATKGASGEYFRKETGWVTNNAGLAAALSGSSLAGSRPWPRHIHLGTSRADAARVYSPELVEAIVGVLKAELEASGELHAGSLAYSGPVPEHPHMEAGEWGHYWDDVNGGYLDPELVKGARAIERAWVKKQGIYDIVPLKQCWD